MSNIYVSNKDCGCPEYNPCTPCNSITVNNGCSVTLDTGCVFYHLTGDSASELTNLNLPNGSDLTTILEAIDDKLQEIDPTFPEYTSTCINYEGFVINTMEDFQTAVDEEFCSVKSSITSFQQGINTQVTNLTNLIDDINSPGIEDDCGLNILSTDNISQVLTKLKDGYCLLSVNTFSDNSPIFAPIESASINWISGGTKGHTPIANIRKSTFPGNNLQILSDGLYVGDILPTTQVLSINTTTRVITLSNGGGSITLPIDKDNQLLSLNESLKRISISGGNSIDLNPIIPVFIQEDITPTNTNSITITATGTANTDISADLNISDDSGNIAEIRVDGLYVPTTTVVDERVKADAADTSSGYLIDKVEGSINTPLTTSVAYNGTTDKVTISTVLDLEDLIDEINDDAPALSALQTTITDSICFRFKIVNTDGALSKTYDYLNCSGSEVTGVTLSANASIILLAKGVFSSDDEINIYNLGFNF